MFNSEVDVVFDRRFGDVRQHFSNSRGLPEGVCNFTCASWITKFKIRRIVRAIRAKKSNYGLLGEDKVSAIIGL